MKVNANLQNQIEGCRRVIIKTLQNIVHGINKKAIEFVGG